jgi:hypothetical protein
VGAAGAGGVKAEAARLRVGTFDSRAVAVAYVNSDAGRRYVRQISDEYQKAKAAHDEPKAKQLAEKGRATQDLFHQQGFGTASVANILAEIKDQLPGVARQAGVDVIVSKWDLAYQSEAAAFVDVTELLVQPFHPNEKVRRWIEQLRQKAPISAEELRKHPRDRL